jgi:hypothetical protein
MPVAIQEVSAEVEPMHPEASANLARHEPPETSRDIEVRRQHDLLDRLERRAARLAAD